MPGRGAGGACRTLSSAQRLLLYSQLPLPSWEDRRRGSSHGVGFAGCSHAPPTGGIARQNSTEERRRGHPPRWENRLPNSRSEGECSRVQQVAYERRWLEDNSLRHRDVRRAATERFLRGWARIGFGTVSAQTDKGPVVARNSRC